MLYPPGFYYVKKTKRFVICSSDKSSECNLYCFFDIIKPRRIEHLQKEESFSSDPYFSNLLYAVASEAQRKCEGMVLTKQGFSNIHEIELETTWISLID